MHFRIISLSALFTLAAHTLAAAPAAPTTLQLEPYQGHQYAIRATLHGTPQKFLFDTGEGITMISPALASKIGCNPWGNVTGFTMLGQRLDTPRCDNISFAFPSITEKAPETIIYDLGIIAGKDAPPLDGSIGLDIFAGQAITIKLASYQLIMETPETLAERQRQGVEIPMRLVRDAEGAALSVDLAVDTPNGPAWMELDTGNTGPTIFVSKTIAPLLHLNPATTTAKDAPQQKVTLTLAHKITWSGEARVFPNMIMDGNIGTQFLKSWTITLDLKSTRAWLSH
jgi:predicted aspartyl protease